MKILARILTMPDGDERKAMVVDFEPTTMAINEIKPFVVETPSTRYVESARAFFDEMDQKVYLDVGILND